MPALSKSPHSPKEQGFSLIVTITMLILLSLIAVGLLSLASITLRSSEASSSQAIARANARLGLAIALGDLQRYLGPDARISARAVTLAQDDRIGVAINPGEPRSWWVGAAHGDPNQTIDQSGRAAVWFISGLDTRANASAQINSPSPFQEPIALFDQGSLDLTLLTGGDPIEAGKVPVRNDANEVTGATAWIVDDHGMKAQLAATDPEVRNDRQGDPFGHGILPGSYDLGELREMETLAGIGPDDFNRLISLKELRFLGALPEVEKRKRFSYTTRSRGVLSDVRNGGLKKDLTFGFENDRAFASNLAGGRGNQARYIVVEPDRLESASELVENGYIHWDVFRDYYNLKKHIQSDRRNGDYLHHIAFTKEGLFNRTNDDFYTGQLGPHAMGGATPSTHTGHPYGEFAVYDVGRPTDEYKHSPITPVLSLLQQRAWLELTAARRGSTLQTNVQLWSSHYNPYNIGMMIRGDLASTGPRIINYPQVDFTLGNALTRETGLANKRQAHVPHEVLLSPGRSHVAGFSGNGEKGKETDARLYNDTVKDLVLESVFEDYTVAQNLTGDYTMSVNFILQEPSLMHGQDEGQGSREVSQVLYAPFSWDEITNGGSSFPGKSISDQVNASEINENTVFSMEMRLRTTQEDNNTVRPLIDANIRAIWSNPKWDSPLGLPNLAAYTMDTDGEPENPDDPTIQMNTADAPKGYSYLGSGNGPSDGHDRVILFDVPRRDLLSLGQLQHAGAGRFSYEPSYIVGNSYANPRIPQDEWRAGVQDTYSNRPGLRQWAIRGSFNLYDASYLVNEALWDRYIFTTIPQVNDDYAPGEPSYNFEEILTGTQRLPNPRFLPYVPAGSSFDQATLQNDGNSFDVNAGHLMVDGAFNINSTSVDAWEAFLSGTKGLPYGKIDQTGKLAGFDDNVDGVRFPRVASNFGDGRTIDGMDQNFWNGFRELTSEEVRELAEAIVEQIQVRGPSYGLADFVNRRLEEGAQGQSGPLQAALDSTLNDDIGDFALESTQPGTQGAGYPGAILQGDLLQALSPYMTARSDTFAIRAYGESRNPRTGKIEAQAWCEAIVQRYPDPILEGSESNPLAELAQPSNRFGRRFRLQSFRWLNSQEI